uniref:Uncharacterized protein n=1 Tax=Timema douglasi TaxID=61478 RepID=A0A7R8VME1_TIMDO|nr:unnamed protein product [Timema douglasi]
MADEDAKFENEDLSGGDDDDDTWSITTGRNKYTYPRKSFSKQKEISRYQRMISHLQNKYIQEEYLHAILELRMQKRWLEELEKENYDILAEVYLTCRIQEVSRRRWSKGASKFSIFAVRLLPILNLPGTLNRLACKGIWG